MTKLKAVILWPYVYFLDILTSTLTDQTFKRSRAISKIYYYRIISRDKVRAAERAKQREIKRETGFSNPFRIEQDA